MKKPRETSSIQQTLCIDYLQGLFTNQDLKTIEKLLWDESISLISHSHQPQPIAGLEELFAQVSLFLSQDIVQSIVLGLATNGVYDALKQTLLFVHHKLKNKSLLKLEGGKTEEVKPTIHFIIGGMRAILPLNIDEEKYKYFVDKMFASIDTKTVSEECYCKYDDEHNTIQIQSKDDIVFAAYQQQISHKKTITSKKVNKTGQ